MTEKIIRIGQSTGIHGRVNTKRLLDDYDSRIHKALDFNEGGGIMTNFLDKDTFNQFDLRITDKLNDIRIDTNKIKEIDESVNKIKSDISHVRVSTNTLEKDFGSVKSDVVVIKSSATSIHQSIVDEFKTQKEELTAFKTEIKDEVISFKSTTMWSAIGVGVAILIGAGGIIAAII